jgi:ribosomal protein L29
LIDWRHHLDLQTLKNNNARLKTALQESASNVEEWKTQLTAWKEECIRLRAQVKELRASGGSEAAAEAETLKDELSRLRGRISSLEAEKSALETQTMVRAHTRVRDQLSSRLPWSHCYPRATYDFEVASVGGSPANRGALIGCLAQAASGGKRQMADQIGVLGGQFASKLAELNALQAQLTRIADN